MNLRGDDIRGWFTQSEGRRLYHLAKQVKREHEIVEIGAFAGRSTAYLAEGTRRGFGAHITTLDDWSPAALPGGTEQNAADEVLAEFRSHVDNEYVTYLRARSDWIAPYWLKPIGLMFLDASHLYDDTVRDISQWGRHVVIGGYAAFHDYHTNNPGVIQATDEAVAAGEWEHVDLTVVLRVLRRVA